MIQFLMMLLGLAFSENQTNTINVGPTQIVTQSNTSPEDTNGETGQIPPKK